MDDKLKPIIEIDQDNNSFFLQIIKFLHQSIDESNLETSGYQKKFKGLDVAVSFGMGRPAFVPWICFLKEGQKIQNGFYPGLYFDREKSQLFVVLGVSEENKPKQSWPIELTSKYKKFDDVEISTNIKRKYPSSYLFSQYLIDKKNIEKSLDPKKEQLFADLNQIIDVYKNSDRQKNDGPVDSIIISKIAWSYNGWTGFDKEGYKNRNKFHFKHIQEFGLAHEWWMFHDFGSEYYLGHIETGSKGVNAFKNNGLILIASNDLEEKKYKLIGFYGKAEWGEYSLPTNLWDTLSSEEKETLSKDAKSGLIDSAAPAELKERTSFNWRGEKEFSTLFKKFIQFDTKDFGVPVWGRAPYIGVGQRPEKFPKDKTKELLVQALNEHKKLLLSSSGSEKTEIELIIGKIERILEMYFEKTNSNIDIMTLISKNPLFTKIQKVLDYKKQIILYGPPGTGKTWIANNFIKSKNTPETNTRKISEAKKFFWYAVLDTGDLAEYLGKGDTEDDRLGVDGNISNTYEKIEEGDIVIIFDIAKSRLIGISSFSRKYPPTKSGIWDITLNFIQSVQGPVWDIIEKDMTLHNSEPVKYYESNKLAIRSEDSVLDQKPSPQKMLWNMMFPLTQKEGMRLFELAQVLLNEPDKSPDIKAITTDKKFFWYPTKSMKLDHTEPSLGALFLKGEEGVIWYGNLRTAFNETRMGDIIIFYAGSGPDVSWIATCTRKEVPTDGNSRIFVRGIKHFKGPRTSVIRNDAFLRRAMPITKDDFGVLYPLTQEVAWRFLELSQVSLKDIFGEGNTIKAINGDFNEEKSEKISPCNFVTFHPSYAYEEFIEGLRPIADNEGNIRYEIQEGIFKQASREALNTLLKAAEIEKIWQDQSPVPTFTPEEIEKIQGFVDRVPCYLVIDEINRGDISRIFGELITLVEADKRLFCENEMRCILPYSKMVFGIPPNLFIVGTMNTADRSISLMDIALRRRFGFIELLPDYDALKKILINDSNRSEEVKSYRDIAIQCLQKMNERITEKYDRDHQIGHSYLVKLSQDTSVEDTKETLTNIWKYEIIPLLQEYFYDSEEKLLFITNNRFFEKSGSSFVLKTESDIIEALRAIAMTK